MQAHQLDKKLDEFRQMCDAEPITDEKRIALDEFVIENEININDILPEGVEYIGELTQGQEPDVRDKAQKIVDARFEAEMRKPRVLSDEEREALLRAERYYHEAQSRRSHSSTHGT